MNPELRDRFTVLFRRYFAHTALPVAFFYSHDDSGLPLAEPGSEHRCLIANLAKVSRVGSMRLSVDSIGCAGGKRYCGFTESIRPNFNHFLSTGIPGVVEGERYKKSPELVEQAMARAPVTVAPAPFLVLKRWDLLQENDQPEAVIFVVGPDALSGLFTLANFDESEPLNVIAPFGAGCGTTVQYAYIEQHSERPRCVLGSFDPSARPYLRAHQLSFAVPMRKLASMIENIEESFLTTPTWDRLRKRIEKDEA